MAKLDVTVEQLRSIYGQLYDALDEKARLHLPAEAAEGTDQVRREVGMQLQEFLATVIEMASSSVRVVNSDDARGALSAGELIARSQERYVEPFDLELNERVRQAYQEWEDQTVQVSQLRRNAPQQVNRAYVEARDSYLAELDSRINQLQAEVHEHFDEGGANTEPTDDVARWNTLATQYEQSLQTLRNAQATLPQTRADISKMKHLVAYLEDQLD